MANSVGPRWNGNTDILADGVLAKQFGQAGGPELVEDLKDPSRLKKKFGFGDIIFTDLYDMYKGVGSPEHICHICVPRQYNEEYTYTVSLNS